MQYIQRRQNNETETVDECDNWKEARRLVQEYSISDPSAHYYTSQRACKEWRLDHDNTIRI